MNATPTDADRQVARECVTYDLGSSMDRVAQALADQRAKYEAVADELDSHVKPRSFHPAGTHSDGASQAYADAAERVRKVGVA